MKVLIPILMGLLVVGCGKKEPSISRDEIVELETRKALRHRFDSNPESKGAIINSLVLQKEGENKYVGSVEITDPDGSKMKLDLEVTDHGGKIFFETKLPQKIVSEKPESPPNNLIVDPILEKAIRKELKKPEGKLTKADFEKVKRPNLSENQLTEVPKGLENLTKMGTLNLNRNQLIDVKGLEKLTQLKYLHLSYNPDLTKAKIDELQKALPKCKIYSDPTK